MIYNQINSIWWAVHRCLNRRYHQPHQYSHQSASHQSATCDAEDDRQHSTNPEKGTIIDIYV